ncbi:glycosyltransferase family A protein [Variovorax rhizosphaerae]|uniref:Glycosyltransferase family A protein n=1 Tax=Variovorax rhizosphaerae TaxID=1836200 RepID=A0ABU8WE72_9BURK
MLISVLIPAYARPEQLGDALASIALQDRSVVGEVIVSDDSPRAYWERNQAVIASSGVADLVAYSPNEPSLGIYPNHWSLAEKAKCSHVLFLHNDDMLCPGGLRVLSDMCENETDPRVKLWFGNCLITDENGRVDPVRTAERDRDYGRTGPARAEPMWQWCLTESIPPNCFLVEREAYLRHMRGSNDGNVGDWATNVRMANDGAWARSTRAEVSLYRVQDDSVTNAGRGVDVHRSYEFFQQLEVPPEFVAQKDARLAFMAPAATVRYARDGERRSAWTCYLSGHWSWRKRLSARGAKALVALMMPKPLWKWALRYRD